MRRIVDVVVSAVALAAMLPVLVVAAVAIRLDSAGPVIHRSVRVGKDGVPFALLELRSTVHEGGEERPRPGEWSTTRTGPGPGVTRVGRVLRWASIDELPQLWNVLRGDLSLIGPPPTAPAEEAGGPPAGARERLRVVPGLTGTWRATDTSGDAEGTDRHTPRRIS